MAVANPAGDFAFKDLQILTCFILLPHMKKILASAAFALISLAATSAHAQSTISPVPGAPDKPHEPAPTSAPDQQIVGQTRSDSQLLPANGSQSNGQNMSGNNTSASKSARKQHKMKSKTTSTGTM